MIKSFADRQTEALYQGILVKGVAPDLARTTRRKLQRLDQARTLRDLAAFPGNRLEKKLGDRAGQYCIWVDRQWRICFRWQDGDAYNVWFGDYH